MFELARRARSIPSSERPFDRVEALPSPSSERPPERLDALPKPRSTPTPAGRPPPPLPRPPPAPAPPPPPRPLPCAKAPVASTSTRKATNINLFMHASFFGRVFRQISRFAGFALQPCPTIYTSGKRSRRDERNHKPNATNSLNPQQLYLEVEVGVGWDCGWSAHWAVGQFARNPEPALAADFHRLQAFIPTGYNPAELKIDWLFEIVRVVELGAVFQAADVVDRDGLAHLRAGAIANSEILVLQA